MPFRIRRVGETRRRHAPLGNAGLSSALKLLEQVKGIEPSSSAWKLAGDTLTQANGPQRFLTVFPANPNQKPIVSRLS
jgi:hypothetical protein